VNPPPLDSARPPPVDRYCDLVLTGGVTDGVIYPWAVIELAREYHFKNIGGTSVGAMAAALTAAAEYGRRHGRLTGYNDILMKLPGRLGEDVPGVGTRIYSLFQPAKSTKRLFELFVRFFSSGKVSFQDATTAHVGSPKQAQVKQPSGRFRRARAKVGKASAKASGLMKLLGALAFVYRSATILGCVIGLLLFVPALGAVLDSLPQRPLWAAILLVALVLPVIAISLAIFWALLCVAFAIGRDLLYGLVENDYGMCTGMRAPGVPDDRPSLIEWLHEGVQLAAAKPWDEPLTFRDLWDAPNGPPIDRLPPSRRQKAKSIDLHMITTNVTHGRPYEFPLDGTTRLFFRPGELRRFFPRAVVSHLVRYSPRYTTARPDDPPVTRQTRKWRELPTADLPVVVAARLSLSFPFLFSAIPLWEVDRETKSRKDRRLARCRFSDGGICSNFPIHMFDAAVPEWPTFGIALESRSVFRPEQKYWLTRLHYQGADDPWFRFDEKQNPVTHEPTTRSAQLLGFLGSIFYSAKDWNDKIATRLPGVRDRIVHITLEKMGGLNLRITEKEIMDLAEHYGVAAGRALVRKFIDQTHHRPARAWDEHRWVRFNTFLVGLRERIEMIRQATEYYGYGQAVSAQIRDATRQRPLNGTDDAGAVLTARQAQELEALLEQLKRLEEAFADNSLPQPYDPLPRPGLHIRARL